MEEKVYPDRDDLLTQDMISRDFDADYWAQSENRALNHAEAFLTARYGDRLASLSLLDLGCGTGRLIPRFARLVREVTAIDPDPVRCAQARDTVEREGVNNARILQTTLEALLAEEKETSFDLVLCSHVLQHLLPEQAEELLSSTAKCLSAGGALILATTFTVGTENRYIWAFWKDRVRYYEEIDAARFAQALSVPDSLASCRFCRPWLEERLHRVGFDVKECLPFHFGETSDVSLDRSSAEDPERLSQARDALYLCERGKETVTE